MFQASIQGPQGWDLLIHWILDRFRMPGSNSFSKTYLDHICFVSHQGETWEKNRKTKDSSWGGRRGPGWSEQLFWNFVAGDVKGAWGGEQEEEVVAHRAGRADRDRPQLPQSLLHDVFGLWGKGETPCMRCIIMLFLAAAGVKAEPSLIRRHKGLIGKFPNCHGFQ